MQSVIGFWYGSCGGRSGGSLMASFPVNFAFEGVARLRTVRKFVVQEELVIRERAHYVMIVLLHSRWRWFDCQTASNGPILGNKIR